MQIQEKVGLREGETRWCRYARANHPQMQNKVENIGSRVHNLDDKAVHCILEK